MKYKNQNFIFVVLDALRGDHVNDQYMPFLNSMKKKSIHIESLELGSGFCERSEIFFGQSPEESGFVHAISPNSASKPYSWMSNTLINLLKFLELNLFLKKVIRRLLWRFSISKGEGMYPQRIPLHFLKRVGLTEDDIDFEDYAKKLKKGLLFKLISKDYRIDWTYFTSLSSELTSSDEDRLKSLPNALEKIGKHFIPVYISSPDVYGHRFGPHSKELIAEIRKLDTKLESFYKRCKVANPNTRICFIGDHGMETVTKVLNLHKEITFLASKSNIKEGQDFNIFIDSTCIRFWFKDESNEKIRNFILNIKDNKLFNKNGHFLDENLRKNEDLPPIKEMADLIWWASKGVQIAPDFFHDSDQGKAGMHGYLKIDNISTGFLICESESEQISYYPVCRCNELGDMLL